MNSRRSLIRYRSHRNRQRQRGKQQSAFQVHSNSEPVFVPASKPKQFPKKLSISMPRVTSIGLNQSHADALSLRSEKTSELDPVDATVGRENCPSSGSSALKMPSSTETLSEQGGGDLVNQSKGCLQRSQENTTPAGPLPGNSGCGALPALRDSRIDYLRAR